MEPKELLGFECRLEWNCKKCLFYIPENIETGLCVSRSPVGGGWPKVSPCDKCGEFEDYRYKRSFRYKKNKK